MGKMDMEILESEKDSNLSEPFPKNLNPCRRILFSIAIGLAIIIFGVLLAALGYQNYKLWKSQNNLDDLSPQEKTIHYVVGRGGAKMFKSNPKEKSDAEGYGLNFEPRKFFFNDAHLLNPKCENLPPFWHNGSKITPLNGTCIRIYSKDNCVGLSTAHYPKRSTSYPVEAGEMKSIGPCFNNELDDFTQKYSVHSGTLEFQKRVIVITFGVNYTEIPDQIEILPQMATEINPSQNYKSDSNSNSSPNSSDENSSNAVNFKRIYLTKSDLDENQVLPEKILLPKFKLSVSTSWNLRLLFKVEKDITNFLSSNPEGTSSSFVLVKIQMDGPSKSSAPSGFLYRIQFGQSHTQTFYLPSDQSY